MRRGKWPMRCAVLLAIMLVAVGCGSSSKPAANRATTSSPSTSVTQPTSAPSPTAATGTPIKLGVLCTCSGLGGLGALILPAQDDYVAWAKTINASGGINGHPVQVITKDDAGNPGTSASDFQALVADHVVAIADFSQLDSTWTAAAQASKIPIVGGLDSQPFGANADFYPEAQTNNSAVYAVLATAKEAGATSFANVYCAESPECALSAPAFKATGTQLGIPVTYNAEVAATTPNYTAPCLAAQQQHVTSVYIGDSPSVVIRFAGDCSQQGYNPIYLLEGSGFSMDLATAPGLKNALWLELPALPFFATTNSGVQAAKAAMDKNFPGVWENPNLYNEDSFLGWVSGVLLEHAVKAGGLTASGTPTAAEVTTGLDSLKNDTLGGLTVPLSFTAGQPHNINCWFTGRVTNAVPALVNNGKVSCENGSSS